MPQPFSLWEAHWQMSVAFTRFWLASSTSLLLPACVTSALTSHVTSGRSSEGIPVAGQTSDDFQRLRLQLANGRKTHFLDALGLEITLKTDKEWTERGGPSVNAAKTTKAYTLSVEREGLAPGYQTACKTRKLTQPWLIAGSLDLSWKLELVWLILYNRGGPL